MAIKDMSFSERFNYYATQVARKNGYGNLGEMAGSAMRQQQTCASGAGPAIVALMLTVGSYFK